MTTDPRLHPLLAGSDLYAEALHRDSRIRAARAAIKSRLVGLDLSSTQHLIAFQLADAIDEVDGEFETVCHCTELAGLVGAYRETPAALILQLDTLGAIELLERGKGARRWRFRWLFTAAERQTIEADARRLARQSISDTYKYNLSNSINQSFHNST
jgi:hypothetical protein